MGGKISYKLAIAAVIATPVFFACEVVSIIYSVHKRGQLEPLEARAQQIDDYSSSLYSQYLGKYGPSSFQADYSSYHANNYLRGALGDIQKCKAEIKYLSSKGEKIIGGLAGEIIFSHQKSLFNLQMDKCSKDLKEREKYFRRQRASITRKLNSINKKAPAGSAVNFQKARGRF